MAAQREVEEIVHYLPNREWWQIVLALTVIPLSMVITLLLLIPVGIMYFVGWVVRMLRHQKPY